MDDKRTRLSRMAAEAADPSDREWAKQRLAALGVEAAPAAAAASSQSSSQPAASPSFFEHVGNAARALASKAEPFLSPLNDALSFGYWSKGMDAAGMDSPEHRAQMAAENPTATDLGRGTGMGLSAVIGPAAATGKAVAAGVTRAAESVAPRLADTVVGRIGQAAAAGAGTGALVGAAEAGGHDEDIAAGAGRGAVAGGVAGGGLQTVAEGARGVSDLIRKNPWIKRYGDAKAGGNYETPEQMALPKGEEGIQKAAEQGRNRIVERNGKLLTEAGDKYDAAIDAALAKMPEKSPDAIVAKLEELRAGNRLGNGDVRDRGFEGALDEAKRRLGMKQVRVQHSEYQDRPEDFASVSDTKDLIDARRSLKDDAGFGQPNPTPEQRATKKVYHAIREPLRKDVPGLGQADDEFSAAKTAADRRNDILHGSEDSPAMPLVEGEPPVVRAGAEKQAASKLRTVGDTTVPGLSNKAHLEELADSDPEIRAAIEFILDKKAREAVRFGMPKIQTTLTKVPQALAAQNARAIGARVVEPTASAVEGAARYLPPPGPLPSGGQVGAASIIQMIGEAARRHQQMRITPSGVTGGRARFVEDEERRR